MKLILFVMIRDGERQVDRQFSHFTSLFDEIYVVDHSSVDQTPNYIGKWSTRKCKIKLFSLDYQGYIQSELANFFTRKLVDQEEEKESWLFYLDVDEFLPYKSRESMERDLLNLSEFDFLLLSWINLARKSYKNNIGKNEMVYCAPTVSPFGKIAVRLKSLKNVDFKIEQGYHGLSAPKQLACGQGTGIFHAPIENIEQLQTKIKNGVKAYKDDKSDRPKEQGAHWFQIETLLKNGVLSDDICNGLIANYGEVDVISQKASSATLAMSQNDLIENNWREMKFNFVSEKKPAAKSVISNAVIPISFSDGELRTEDKVFKAPSEDVNFIGASLRFHKLSNRVSKNSKNNFEHDLSFLKSKSVDKIQIPVSTAWAGHIPFMFGLISTLKPRRFVELGTHNGASFFAACQATKREEADSELVAIDLWEGDYQAGYYDETIYKNFEFLRKHHYPKMSKSIRSTFNEASVLFENESIDMLHIDGLHSFEAVKEDYETWKPKLTKNSVVLFHDTNEYQSDFGVWDLFDRVRGQASASFDFKHTHGLGVMAFGDKNENPIISILEEMNSSSIETENYFRVLGNVCENASVYEYIIKQQGHSALESETNIDNFGYSGNNFELALSNVPFKNLVFVAMGRVRNRLKRNSRGLIRKIKT